MSRLRHPEECAQQGGSYAYLDHAREERAGGLRDRHGLQPDRDQRGRRSDLNKRIGFTPDEIKALVDLDYGYMTQNDVALKSGGTRS
jgi:putative spermidine/putrescine transport system substrate-binding protein